MADTILFFLEPQVAILEAEGNLGRISWLDQTESALQVYLFYLFIIL